MSLDERIAEAKREYHREWQRRNKDKVKLYNDRYWKKKVETERELI